MSECRRTRGFVPQQRYVRVEDYNALCTRLATLREAAESVIDELTGKGFYGDECEVCSAIGYPETPRDENGVPHEEHCALVALRALIHTATQERTEPEPAGQKEMTNGE